MSIMLLAFEDFAEFYRDSGLSDVQQRDHFECFSSILECIARLFWSRAHSQNSLGITLDHDSLALAAVVESDETLRDTFSDVAGNDAEGGDTQ